jgi:dihydroorotate dehydrogenase
VSADLSVVVAGLELANPVIAGSGESSASVADIRACLDAGAAAVVAKSVNESLAARAQLRAAEYVVLDRQLQARPLGPMTRGDSLFCRSGLLDIRLDEWIETLARLDRDASKRDAYVVPSLIVADPDEAARHEREFEEAGVRWLELNVGAPHAEEAAPGALRTGVELVAPIRAAVSIPLTVKLNARESVADALAAGADALCLTTRAMGFVPDLATRRPLLGTFAAIGGAWALPLSLREVAKAHLAHPEASIIGTNGAWGGHDVARFLLAGASAVAMTSAVITGGHAVLRRTLDELALYCVEQGVSARDLVGEAARHVQLYEEVAIDRGL